MKRMKRIQRRTSGFSLIELTVSLAVVAAVGLVVWRVMPGSRLVAEGAPVAAKLQQAQDAVDGFALRMSRLPCPAVVGGDGRESCDANAFGELPWRTLGLGRSEIALRYGVYRDATINLGAAANRFTPNLPPLPVVPVATYNPAQINGLDLCAGLRGAAALPMGLLAGGVPVAYAVADAGANRRFDLPYTATFPLPGAPTTIAFDDEVVATGLGEMSARLGCVTRMGEMQAAARSAYAAYDLHRDADMFSRFRTFAHKVRVTDKEYAIANVAITALDLAIATAASISALSIASNSVGITTPNVIAAGLAIAAAAAAQVVADVQLVAAVAAEVKAGKQATDALLLLARALADRDAAVAAAQTVDRKGLLP